MRVIVERSGGFMGRSVRFDLAGEELSDEQRRRVEAFAVSAHEDATSSAGPLHSARPDAFHYRLTVESDGSTATRVVDESTAPPELLAVLHWVVTHGTRS